VGFILVYITNPNASEARKLASALLERRLAACANFFPIRSTYLWKGKARNSREVVSILKTRAENWERLKTEVQRLHPYEVPCIIKIPVQANRSYEDWIRSETR
jgi:periplasmic divalent cation tolerance protein